jgi:ATP-dependent protease HslVU (ClpYQ) peptidase subunit
MTTIIALKDKNGSTHLATDGRTTAGDFIVWESTSKIIKFPKYHFSISNYSVYKQIIRNFPEKFADLIIEEERDVYLFVQNILECLETANAPQDKDDDTEELRRAFYWLLITPNNLYEFSNQGDVIEREFYAVGSGSNFALGYLAGHAIEHGGFDNAAHVCQLAIQVASNYDTGTNAVVSRSGF